MKLVIYSWIFAFVFSLPVLADQYIIVCLAKEGHVESWKIKERDGSLEFISRLSIPSAHHTAKSPRFPYLYISGSMQGEGDKSTAIFTVRIQENGKLKLIHRAKTTHIVGAKAMNSQGTVLFTMHYKLGKISSYLLEDGIYRGTELDRLNTDKNPHDIAITPDDRYIYVPHTTANKVFQFSYDALQRKILPLDPPYVDGPTVVDPLKDPWKPRNVIFHPYLPIVYTSDEAVGGLSAYDRKSDGTLSLKQTMRTRSDDYKRTRNRPSNLGITSDGQFIFVVNRDKHRSKSNEEKAIASDGITSFQLDKKNGKILKRIGIYPTGRSCGNLRIDHTGKFVYVLEGKSEYIHIYKINQRRGSLTRTKIHPIGKNPRGMTIVRF